MILVFHWPLLRLARQSIAGLGAKLDRRIVFCGLGAILAAYLVIFAMVFDYARWISSLFVCLWLAVHALRQMPSAPRIPLPLPTARNRRFAWLVTMVPCVGTVTPF